MSVGWQKATVRPGISLKDAIQSLDASSLQIVLVVAADGMLKGTLTDGDIRRGLLRGHRLDDPIDLLIKQNPVVVPPTFGRDAALSFMQVNSLRQLPVVDDMHRLIGLHLLDELLTPGERNNLMIIMAGGRGTRLAPLTEMCPKPMLPVGGKPMLQHIIERARVEGFRNFTLAIHYLGQVIEEHFGTGAAWDVKIDYLRETRALGTAGAISLMPTRPNAPIVVSNGDVLTDIRYGDLLDFHLRSGAAATMAVRLHEWEHPFGVVHTKGIEIVGFEEKPISRTHINAGVYVLEPTALEFLEPNVPCDMPILFERLKNQGFHTVAYPMHEPWLDVGQREDLLAAQAEYAGIRRDGHKVGEQ